MRARSSLPHSKKTPSHVVLSISFGIDGFLEWGAAAAEVHSWARRD